MTGLAALLEHPTMPEFVRKADEVLHAYRGAWRFLTEAFIASLITQIVIPLSAWMAGRAFGIATPAGVLLRVRAAGDIGGVGADQSAAGFRGDGVDSFYAFPQGGAVDGEPVVRPGAGDSFPAGDVESGGRVLGGDGDVFASSGDGGGCGGGGNAEGGGGQPAAMIVRRSADRAVFPAGER